MPARVEARFGVHDFGLGLFHPDVGHHQRADLQAVVEQAFGGEELHDLAAETADRAFFDGDQHLVVAGKLADEIVVQWFGEASIGNRCR